MRRSGTVGRLVTAKIQRLATASPSDPVPCGGSDGDDSRQGRTRGGFASPSSAHCRKDQKRGDSSGSDSRGLAAPEGQEHRPRWGGWKSA